MKNYEEPSSKKICIKKILRIFLLFLKNEKFNGLCSKAFTSFYKKNHK
jgi:hypothetical protein